MKNSWCLYNFYLYNITFKKKNTKNENIKRKIANFYLELFIYMSFNKLFTTVIKPSL